MWDSILKSIGACTNYLITFKVFLTSNFSTKHKILHFFEVFIFRGYFLCLCK